MTTFTETALPALVFSVPSGHPLGTASALGSLTINELQNVNQSWLVWGCETNDFYTHTSSSGSGGLFYEAESRTLVSGSTVVTLTGSSGGGTNNAVLSPGLPTSYVPILSTQATGGGAHLTHVGQFRVFARMNNVSGAVSTALDWAVGDFLTFARNDAVTLTADMAGSFRIVDLGLVTIPRSTTGSQRWQGRIMALSPAGGDAVNIDCMWLVPVTVASGEATAAPPSGSALDLAIYDAFTQTAGALTGKVTSLGAATWTSQGGDPDDWTVDATNHIATRTAISDGSRRVISAGTTNYTTTTAQIDVRIGAIVANMAAGLALRIVDSSNYYAVSAGASGATIGVDVRRTTAGSLVFAQSSVLTVTASVWYTLKASVDTTGRLLVWFYPQGGTPGSPVADYTHTQLATGGTHASGKVGVSDLNASSNAAARDLDNFLVYTPSAGAGTDAVLYASQSAQIRSDSAVREDSTGTFWQPFNSYEGDLLRIPQTSRAGRSIRFVVKTSRSAPLTGADAGIDDISANLSYTPRYLSVPPAT